MSESASSPVSVIIPAYNVSRAHLHRLYRSLLRQEKQEFEVIIVDDCSSRRHYDEIISDSRFRVIDKVRNSGPAASRNLGAEQARYEHLFFTDSDCALHPQTLQRVSRALTESDDCAHVGDTVTEVGSWFGEAVACLGYPGGGSIGFEKVWKVDAEGRTNSISSCNLAINRRLFSVLGGFVDCYPVPGGEDTEFAVNLLSKGYGIRYHKEQVVFHVEQESLSSFWRWTFTRGRGIYHFSRRVRGRHGYLSLRLWSLKNGLQAAGRKAPLVLLLFLLMLISIQCGFHYEKKRLQ